MNEESIKAEEVTTGVSAAGTNEDKIDSTSNPATDTAEDEIDGTSIPATDITEDKMDTTKIPATDTDENKVDSTKVSVTDTNEDKKDNTSIVPMDLSKVKIRHILRDRIKKGNLGFKKIIAFILVGAVCFGAGFFTGTASTRHKLGRNFYGKPGINRNMQGNFKGNKKFKAYPNNGVQSPQKDQSQIPAQDKSQGQSKN